MLAVSVVDTASTVSCGPIGGRPDLRSPISEDFRIMHPKFKHAISTARDFVLESVARQDVYRRWRRRNIGALHDLPGQLVVSLTSYSKRFPELHLTLKCLLTQRVAADKVILWVGEKDAPNIPKSVKQMQDDVFEIRTTEDIRSFTKIIPTLLAFPEAFIVTADDDVYYSSNWMQKLVSSRRGLPREIVCHRAHEMKIRTDGTALPYMTWGIQKPILDNLDLIFPTGVGGVLYSPGSLHQEVLKKEIFTVACPHADDVWLAWMGRLANAQYTKIPGNRRLICWNGTQETGLFHVNLDNGNDRQIREIEKLYGPITRPVLPEKAHA